MVILQFESELAALQLAVSLQTKPRTTTDSAFYRMCEKYDELMTRGGDRRSEEAKSKMQRCNIDRRHSTSARETAKLIRCHYRKVDKIRKIRRDGWPEIQDAVANDELTINKAYNMIRYMELGEEENEKKMSAARTRAAITLLNQENLAGLKVLGGDLFSLVNLAVEQLISGLQDKQGSEIPEVEGR